jgi:hypothetical protein
MSVKVSLILLKSLEKSEMYREGLVCQGRLYDAVIAGGRVCPNMVMWVEVTDTNFFPCYILWSACHPHMTKLEPIQRAGGRIISKTEVKHINVTCQTELEVWPSMVECSIEHNLMLDCWRLNGIELSYHCHICLLLVNFGWPSSPDILGIQASKIICMTRTRICKRLHTWPQWELSILCYWETRSQVLHIWMLFL